MASVCQECGGSGVVHVPGCTCGGIDIGIGVVHEPMCGWEQCPLGCDYRPDVEMRSTPLDSE